MVMEPEIIVYDEPTSGLDPMTSRVVDALIDQMRERFFVTSLVITHDMQSAYRISDHIAMLYEGRVLESGTPEEIRATENPIVRGFIEGRPELVEAGEAAQGE
jgi:phospholipid/cholesterol/gamma-HCH transport system ATP-binding protein